MDHKAFRQLLKRYLDNSCTDDERKIIDQWYELLDNENVVVIPIKKRNVFPWKYAAAACLLGLVLISGMLWLRSNGKVPAAGKLVDAKVTAGFLEQANTGTTPKEVQLEDGSTVTMYPGS